MKITVDCAKQIGKLEHFWCSTGFSPANLLLNADMRQAMTYVGAVPHGGITYVRVHYLLELVRAKGLGTTKPEYDWLPLDSALDVLVRNGLKPVFELMGDAEGYFTDYADQVQLHAWRRLVRDLALHLIERYGQDEVRSWYFETWNEPDVGFWTQTEEAFCNYYDACSEGLKEADPRLRLGGPGTCRTLSSMFKTFLDHSDRGTNHFTGETGVRLDFISIHEKGVRSCEEDLTPDSQGITDREIEIIEYIRAHHPRFTELPFFNDECDPQVGWGDIHTWRARPYYAALACKIIYQHLVRIVDGLGCNYHLLSNDNGFLGRWGNRTLFARFGDAAQLDLGQAGHRKGAPRFEEDPLRRWFELVKKPIFNLMTLLSLLGDRRCAVSGFGDMDSAVGAVGTLQGDGQVAVLVYNSADRIMSSGSEQIKLCLQGLPFGAAQPVMLAHYRIDEEHGNPFAVWEGMGAPYEPSGEQYAALRRVQELAMLQTSQEVRVRDATLELDFDLPLPSVSLVLLSAKPTEAPGKVTGIRVERYEGLTDQQETMLVWQGVDSKVIHTYEVLHATTPGRPFERVNGADQIDTAFLHVRQRTAGDSYYAVRARDYWGRCGELSDVVTA